MTLSDQKEHFSYAYARAIAAATAVSASKPEVDDDSVDLIFCKKGGGGVVRSPRLDAQVKCADRTTLTISPTHVHYPLKLKNYDDLRPADVLVPRVLLIVLVPDVLTNWLLWTPQELAVRHAGYWLSLRGMPAVANTTNVTVQVPLANEFSVAQFTAMMARIGAGQLP